MHFFRQAEANQPDVGARCSEDVVVAARCADFAHQCCASPISGQWPCCRPSSKAEGAPSARDVGATQALDSDSSCELGGWTAAAAPLREVCQTALPARPQTELARCVARLSWPPMRPAAMSLRCAMRHGDRGGRSRGLHDPCRPQYARWQSAASTSYGVRRWAGLGSRS